MNRSGPPDAGARAEAAGEEYLLEQGYRMVARNHRCRFGEIDRIAWDGEILCFVEIRSRRYSGWGTPAATVAGRKQRKLLLAARDYLGHHPGPLPCCRFDVLCMRPDPQGNYRFELIRDAFVEG